MDSVSPKEVTRYEEVKFILGMYLVLTVILLFFLLIPNQIIN